MLNLDTHILLFALADELKTREKRVNEASDFVEVAAGSGHTVARRSDGSVVAWGDNFYGQCNVPALPPGLTYVEATTLCQARNSRGASSASSRWTTSCTTSTPERGERKLSYGQTNVPALPPGLTYVEVAMGGNRSVARVGPPSTYTFLGPGCAGSMPAARLVPLDTPRLGATFEVRLFDLPANAAIVLTSSQTMSLGLGSFGLPGCTLFTAIEFATPVTGTLGQATYALPIPKVPALIGVTLHQQAIVFDPAAGNPAGLVMSEAKSATIGAP